MNNKIITKVVSKVGPKMGVAMLKIKKASPEILLVAGIGAGVACVVYACKGTLKMEEVLDTHNEKIDEVVKPETNENEKKRLTTRIYVETGMDIAKLYLPSAAFGALSLACICGSHNILSMRVASLTAAYTAVDEAFRDYRRRVVEKYGETEDYNLRYGVKQIGSGKTVKDGVEEIIDSKTMDIEGHSQYAKFFDPSSKEWEKDPNYNLLFLKAQEEYFNNLLKARGYVFLNEVYDALGIEMTPAGQIVGWMLGAGDDYISFGIYNGDDAATRRFVNGLENVILLDFNVDGVIYDKI